jgi:hypothetical protein
MHASVFVLTYAVCIHQHTSAYATTKLRVLACLLPQHLDELRRQHWRECAQRSLRIAQRRPEVLSAYISIRQHTSAYVSIRSAHTSAHTSASSALRREPPRRSAPLLPAPVAYVSIRQHTSAYVSIRQHTAAYVSIRVLFRVQHSSAYVSIREHTCLAAPVARVEHAEERDGVWLCYINRMHASVFVLFYW